MYMRRRVTVAVTGIAAAAALAVAFGTGAAGLVTWLIRIRGRWKERLFQRTSLLNITNRCIRQSDAVRDDRHRRILDGSATISTSGFTLDTDSRNWPSNADNQFRIRGIYRILRAGRHQYRPCDSTMRMRRSIRRSVIKAPFIMALASTGTIDLNAVYQAGDTQNATTKQNIDQVLTVFRQYRYSWLVVRMAPTPSIHGRHGTVMAGYGYVTT